MPACLGAYLEVAHREQPPAQAQLADDGHVVTQAPSRQARVQGNCRSREERSRYESGRSAEDDILAEIGLSRRQLYVNGVASL